MDIAPGIYNTGTATVAAGGLVVSFQGASNLQAMVRPGDRFGGHVGLPIRIASRGVDTVTLAYPWPGPAQTAAPYEISFTPYDLGYRQSLEILIERYGSTAVAAMAELALTGDTLPYGNGNDTMALTALTEFARSLLDDADMATARATLGFNTPAVAFNRGNILGPVSQIGGVPTGHLIERGINANGTYQRFADGTQKCWRTSGVMYGLSSPAGGIFVNGPAVGPYVWPVEFATPPSEQITSHKFDGDLGHCWVASVSRPSQTHSSAMQVFRATSSIDAFFVMIEAEGRWF